MVKVALLGGVSDLGGVNSIGAMTLVVVPLVDLLKYRSNICGEIISSGCPASVVAGIWLEMTVVSVADGGGGAGAGAGGFASGITVTGWGAGGISGTGNATIFVAGWGIGRNRNGDGPTRGR